MRIRAEQKVANFMPGHMAEQACHIRPVTAREPTEKTGAKKELQRTSEPEWQYFNWSLSPDGQTVELAKKMRAAKEAEIRLVPTRDVAERVLKGKDPHRHARLGRRRKKSPGNPFCGSTLASPMPATVIAGGARSPLPHFPRFDAP